jgi:SAM-dependent methyltransferase
MTVEQPLTAPKVRGLDVALGGMRGAMAVLDRHRSTHAVTNTQGGDLGHHASPSLMVRHTVNYLLASEIAGEVSAEGPLLDVGSGVGVFSTWIARRLERHVHVADHDPAVLELTRRAFPDATVHHDLADAPSAAVVTAMEVIEHLAYQDQEQFIRDMVSHVEPGGVLVCSTPDERRYVGGWSGYAPHIGTLDFTGLQRLLHRATGLPAHVWRIDGPGFTLRPAQRWGEPLANRVWTFAQHYAPRLTGRLTGGFGDLRRTQSDSFGPAPADDAFSVTTDVDGLGTGLLAAVFKPTA